jgi:hypothetical protein
MPKPPTAQRRARAAAPTAHADVGEINPAVNPGIDPGIDPEIHPTIPHPGMAAVSALTTWLLATMFWRPFAEICPVKT